MTLNSTPKNMALVPGSSFFMGSRKKSSLFSPFQSVQLKPFYIDIFPVTNEEYARVVQEWTYPPHQRLCPVGGLTREQILEYCSRVGKRLPTEEEWEKAARGDLDDRAYPWGREFSANKCNCRRHLFLIKGKTAQVNSFPQGISPYKCLDMIGNLWEWTSTLNSDNKFILKGGSCTSPSKKYLTIASRLVAGENTINSLFGFRCCISA
jgi:formylglycine-generating enzyme required for sulfatase activity